MAKADVLVQRIRRLDAAMEANLERTGQLAAQRREAIGQLVDLLGSVQQAADRLSTSRAAIYKALREQGIKAEGEG
jgi:DNA invertase Pin-like site-specific DNA recombinase